MVEGTKQEPDRDVQDKCAGHQLHIPRSLLREEEDGKSQLFLFAFYKPTVFVSLLPSC